jgi:hypothetical protein
LSVGRSARPPGAGTGGDCKSAVNMIDDTA